MEVADNVINSFISKLLNLEPVKNSSYIRELRKLCDEIEVNIRNLCTLNVTEVFYGHLLKSLISKLFTTIFGFGISSKTE